jgi:hypothetical protein
MFGSGLHADPWKSNQWLSFPRPLNPKLRVLTTRPMAGFVFGRVDKDSSYPKRFNPRDPSFGAGIPRFLEILQYCKIFPWLPSYRRGKTPPRFISHMDLVPECGPVMHVPHLVSRSGRVGVTQGPRAQGLRCAAATRWVSFALCPLCLYSLFLCPV